MAGNPAQSYDSGKMAGSNMSGKCSQQNKGLRPSSLSIMRSTASSCVAWRSIRHFVGHRGEVSAAVAPGRKRLLVKPMAARILQKMSTGFCDNNARMRARKVRRRQCLAAVVERARAHSRDPVRSQARVPSPTLVSPSGHKDAAIARDSLF